MSFDALDHYMLPLVLRREILAYFVKQRCETHINIIIAHL